MEKSTQIAIGPQLEQLFHAEQLCTHPEFRSTDLAAPSATPSSGQSVH
ncbi:hypothetical protein [Reinekea sp.]|nr:hypothetical protein [Reinekea sp.]